ncbi:MAG: hypothetical protein AB7V27_08590 [Candidatus Binatia bacterium]
MSWRATIGIALALLAAGGYLRYDINRDAAAVARQSAGRDAAGASDGFAPLLAFEPSSIAAVRYVEDGSAFTTERSVRGWSGTARPDDVDEFLRQLSAQAEIRRLAPHFVDHGHGLAPPQATLELRPREGSPIVLLIGNRNPAATAVYVRLGPDGPIALTGEQLLWNIDQLRRRLSAASGSP